MYIPFKLTLKYHEKQIEKLVSRILSFCILTCQECEKERKNGKVRRRMYLIALFLPMIKLTYDFLFVCVVFSLFFFSFLPFLFATFPALLFLCSIFSLHQLFFNNLLIASFQIHYVVHCIYVLLYIYILFAFLAIYVLVPWITL